jgi:hypothetical protein
VAGDADAPKSWLRLAFVCNADAAAELAEQLSACGALAVSLDDAEDQPLYEPASGTTPLWSQTRVSGLFRSDEDPARVLTVLEARTEPGTLRAPRVEVLADRDWVRAYRDAFEPTCFGGRLWVVPSWSQPIALADDQVRITLDPGIAFGTGHHPSTAMCLTWLAGERLHDSTVVDYGCGSGILSVAAAKLGARRVWAVDHRRDRQGRGARSRGASFIDRRPARVQHTRKYSDRFGGDPLRPAGARRTPRPRRHTPRAVVAGGGALRALVFAARKRTRRWLGSARRHARQPGSLSSCIRDVPTA